MVRKRTLSVLGVLAAAVLAAPAASALGSAPATAPPSQDVQARVQARPAVAAAPQQGNDDTGSTGGTMENHSNGGTSCGVFANGSGMGAYCANGGGVHVGTLKERFGGLHFDQCRIRPIPKLLESSVPPNPDPKRGRFVMQACIEGVDWDTVTGGPSKSISFNIVYLDWDTDTKDIDNPLNDYLWSSFDDSSTQLPVPHLRTDPQSTPLVGTNTYLSFAWIDPANGKAVAEGKYAGREFGGPYTRIEIGDLVMEARASKVTIDPNQKDMDPITCDADATYDVDKGTSPCKVVFERSSASAEETSTVEMPARVWNAFWATVEVEWEVRYGFGRTDQVLGDGFTMVLHQEIRVQEAQQVNQVPLPVDVAPGD